MLVRERLSIHSQAPTIQLKHNMQNFYIRLKFVLLLLVSFAFIPDKLFSQSSFSETEVEFKADTVLAEAHFMYCKHLDPSAIGMNLCLNKYIEEWETLLNKYYQALIPYTGGDMRAALVGSQWNWRSYLDKEVALYDSIIRTQLGGGGTPGNIVGTYRATLVKDRAIRMFHYYLFILNEKVK